MDISKKQDIANICENLYKECLREIPQFENNKLIWILNGSTLCNLLYNVVKIDGKEVSEPFKNTCYEYIRKPKGDIDITYVADRPYKFNLDSYEVKRFQSISEEIRDYNFVDSNSILSENDLKEICMMETKSGFTFYAKNPKYLFLYKLKELMSVYYNIIRDVKCLYNIAVSYCDKDIILEVLSELPTKSDYLTKLCENDNTIYNELVNKCLEILNIDYPFIKKGFERNLYEIHSRK